MSPAGDRAAGPKDVLMQFSILLLLGQIPRRGAELAELNKHCLGTTNG